MTFNPALLHPAPNTKSTNFGSQPNFLSLFAIEVFGFEVSNFQFPADALKRPNLQCEVFA